ncbi:hypothetical protein JOC34_003498 [Virgibacillus halotolerans]|uniref:hypothetical protein n=1 Tax=Virgibacillus halotolerans TaxID=1071053 RepID=UPI0019606DFE|nr:hypothetical protein [Virgibacillus halotolerans]MBM7601077.1 hypothetical protein [Virgibacillus halotolerans]
MKKLTKVLCFNVALLMLVGCFGNTNEESTTDYLEKSSVLESTEEDKTETDESTSTSGLEESDTDDAKDITPEESANIDSDSTSSEKSNLNGSDKEEKEKTLSQYSSEQIEYARVWLQLGPNQGIDELNVRQIPAGKPINPNEDTSASYPEDVIQLAGSRLVDGSVTYSGNGDGTINVYKVPLRWGSSVPEEDLDENYWSNYTQSIINDASLIYVDPGNDGEIIELIEVLNVQ